MRKMLALCFLLLLFLLAGCSGAPQSREAGSTTVVSVLGTEGEQEDFTLFAAAEGREGSPPTILQGRGHTPAAGVEDLCQNGQQVVDCAHVEHLLLAEGAGELLPDLLSYAFQEPQLSTETQLWVVQGQLSSVFNGEGDAAQRMAVLKSQGKDKLSFAPVTLREAAAQLAEGDSLLIPYLREEEAGLSFAGFALWREGEIAGRFTGAAARGAALLSGQRVHWVCGNFSLQSGGVRLAPRVEGGRLTGLSVSCPLKGIVTGGWQAEEKEIEQLEEQVVRELQGAWRRMQSLGGDGVGLRERVGAADPLRWSAISQQWEGFFQEEEPEFSVTITVVERA